MISPEITFDFMQLLWFQPLTGGYVDLSWDGVDLGLPLPVSACGLALFIPANMYGGPIRFRLLVDVDESWAAAELGPHDRREAILPLHSEGTPYGLMEFDGSSVILTKLLAEGDYHAVLLRAGIDEKQRDGVYDHSDERHWLLLQPLARSGS
jgi:hypothetical protein